MTEHEPLKQDGKIKELEIGHNVKQFLTIKTIGLKVKNYSSKLFKKKKEKKVNGSNQKLMLFSIYKKEFLNKLKNYINIEKFLPFILIIITLFRFIYLNILIIIYLYFINEENKEIKENKIFSCQCILFIIYLIFLFRSIIDSLDTQIIPIFTYLSVYYKYISFKSHHFIFFQFWPIISMILSYLIYLILFSFLLFFIPWIICDDNKIKYEIPKIFWHWFLGWKYIINIFNGKWKIKYIFNYKYWNEFHIIYLNYFIMSYLPYLFLIGLVFGILLLRHIFLNLKTIFIRFIYKTWKNFKQFYIILIPFILFKWFYLISMWFIFFFGDNNNNNNDNNNYDTSISCKIVSFSVFFIMIVHSIFDALCCPIISIEFFIYFNYIQNIFNPFLKKLCIITKINDDDDNNDNDNNDNDYYNQIIRDKNNEKFIKKKTKKIIKKLKVSFVSFKDCLGKNGLIILMSICWSLIKLLLFYIIFGIIFLFLSVGIIWGNCSNLMIKQSPQLIWKWFIAFKYILYFNNNDWSFINLFNIKQWKNIEIIFINYFIISFIPYFIIIGIIIIFKIFLKLYKYLTILTIGFDKICGSEFTLIFIVFIFYRWLYLIFMWYNLLFSDNSNYISNDNDNDNDTISCKIILISIFIIIIFRSIFDSFLFIEFFIYCFHQKLWQIFIIGLLWNIIKLIISYVIFIIFAIFFLIGFCWNNCLISNKYLSLFWEWFIAPKYLKYLIFINDQNNNWKFKYLFDKKYWKSVKILYLNYFIISYLPIILCLICLFIYYLFNYKKFKHNIIFTLFHKRLQLIVTMLLSYNCSISFIIYIINYSKFNILYIIITFLFIGFIPFCIFYLNHRYFILSLKYYKINILYWFLKTIDWNETFILFASNIYNYGKYNIIWDKKKNYNKYDTKNYNKLYYFYFKSIHNLIKLLFLSISLLFYLIEVFFKFIILLIYILFRFIHYFIIMYIMYYGKLAQIQLFMQHFSRYCVGIKPSSSSSSNTNNDYDQNCDDSLNELKVEINGIWIFNVSIFVQIIFEIFIIIFIVILNNLSRNNFLNFGTIWTLISCGLVLINGIWNILSQLKHKKGLKEILGNEIFGVIKSYNNIQYGLITSDIDDKHCVILGDLTSI